MTPPAGPAADPFAVARQLCVDRTNAYRARARLAPLQRDAASEPCVDGQARADAATNKPHGTFSRCGERAQNTCPGYPGRTPEEVVTSCLQNMFDEGPGCGHHDNMMNTKYTGVACGFFPARAGALWVVQDLR